LKNLPADHVLARRAIGNGYTTTICTNGRCNVTSPTCVLLYPKVLRCRFLRLLECCGPRFSRSPGVNALFPPTRFHSHDMSLSHHLRVLFPVTPTLLTQTQDLPVARTPMFSFLSSPFLPWPSLLSPALISTPLKKHPVPLLTSRPSSPKSRNTGGTMVLESPPSQTSTRTGSSLVRPSFYPRTRTCRHHSLFLRC
jgi:hypothetical protein